MFGKARTGDVMFPPNVQKAFSIWCQVHKDPLTQLAQKSEGAAAQLEGDMKTIIEEWC